MCHLHSLSDLRWNWAYREQAPSWYKTSASVEAAREDEAMKHSKVRATIAKLRNMTVEHNCTPAEAAAHQAEADRLEAKLGSRARSSRDVEPGHGRVVVIYRGDEVWYADENGWIERPGLVRGSPSWRITGATEFATATVFENIDYAAEDVQYSLDYVLAHADDIPWQWPDGSQRTHIIDYDHGYRRMWASPTHRVASVRRQKRPKTRRLA